MKPLQPKVDIIIRNLALIAAKIEVKSALKGAGINLNWASSYDINVAAEELFTSNPDHYIAAATEFYNEFNNIGEPSKLAILSKWRITP